MIIVVAIAILRNDRDYPTLTPGIEHEAPDLLLARPVAPLVAAVGS
jgi:hypothetical protein